MTEQIIVALITVAIPSLTTIITSLIAKKDNYMHNAKQSILQLIVELKISKIYLKNLIYTLKRVEIHTLKKK